MERSIPEKLSAIFKLKTLYIDYAESGHWFWTGPETVGRNHKKTNLG